MTAAGDGANPIMGYQGAQDAITGDGRNAGLGSKRLGGEIRSALGAGDGLDDLKRPVNHGNGVGQFLWSDHFVTQSILCSFKIDKILKINFSIEIIQMRNFRLHIY